MKLENEIISELGDPVPERQIWYVSPYMWYYLLSQL